MSFTFHPLSPESERLTPPKTVDVMKCMLWSNLQLGAAIPGACLLTYRPLLSKPALFLTRLFRSSSSCPPSQQSSSLSAPRNQPQTYSNPSMFFDGGAKDDRQEKPSDVAMTGGSSTRTRALNDEGGKDWPLDGSRAKSPMEIV